jgi:hypothetical protein
MGKMAVIAHASLVLAQGLNQFRLQCKATCYNQGNTSMRTSQRIRFR